METIQFFRSVYWVWFWFQMDYLLRKNIQHSVSQLVPCFILYLFYCLFGL